MKTLADLRRDLSIGTKVTLTYCTWTHKNLNVPRYVVKKQGNGVAFATDQTATGGSFFDFPRASLLTYKDDEFNIHAPIERPLTKAEQTIMDNRPSKRPENQEQLYNDLMTDGSQMFHADRRYFQEQDAQYLEGFETVRGLRYNFNNQQVTDESQPGIIQFTYKICQK